MDHAENAHHGVSRYHCTAGLQFDWLVFYQTKNTLVFKYAEMIL